MNDADISELLLRWQESRQRGSARSAEELCAGRPELLAELERRIAALTAMERRLALKPDLAAAATIDEADGSTTRGNPAPQIAGYELLSQLDQGGMGIVYKARQLKLQRVVALKMIRGDVASRPEHRARFQIEARAIAQLQHPNIVHIHEIGEAEGQPFFTMEYVEGGSLAQRTAGHPLPPRQAAELLATVADAIHFAHQRGVIHRDLKPANVLLAGDVPKITDFGLAKRLNGEPGASGLMGQTQTGMILGTPSYMAPEQAAGKPREIGPAADIYALGAILYELLTGRPPFAGATTLETLLLVMSSDPDPPSQIQPAVPRDLETICLKCLEKSPERRYASAGDLAADLRRFLAGQPITAQSPSLLRRIVKLARRRREAALAAGALALILLFWGAAAAWSHFQSAREERQLAQQLAPRARIILTQYCWSCHGQDPRHTEGNLDILDHDKLLGRLVAPGDVAASHLIHRIEDGSMPPEEEEEFPRLSSDEIEVLKRWVAGGAPPFAPPGPADHAGFDAPPAASAVAVKKIFEDKCLECHRLGSAKNGIKILNHDLLVNKRRIVIPGNPAQSSLYKSLITPDPKKLMPPPDAFGPLDQEEIETVARWIQDGAPAFPRTHRARQAKP